MGEFLLIILIAVVSMWLKGGGPGSVRRQKRPQGQSVREYQTWQNRSAVQRPQRNPQTYQNQNAQEYQAARQAAAVQMQQAAAAMSQKQKELKERLQQKYPGTARGGVQQSRNLQSYPGQPYQARQTAPVQSVQPHQAWQTEQGRGAQNVQQAVKPGDIVSRAAENVRGNDADLLEKEDFLANVETLMITGYQAKLTYERDFLSEGMDLLNSYRIPDAVPEYAEWER